MTGSQVLKEALTTVLTDRRSIWWHLGLMAIGTLFTAISWPGESLAQYLEQGRGPNTFSTVTQVTAVFLFTIGGAFTLDRISRKPGYSFARWIQYTPVGTLSYLNARIAFHLVHTILLVFLALPFLTLAAVGSLSSPFQALWAAAYLAFVSFCQRVMAEAGRRSDRATGSLGFLIYILAIILFMLLTFSTFPEWNPVKVLRNISVNGAEKPSLSSLLKTGALHLLLALSGYAVSAWRLNRAARVVKVS